MTTKNLLAILLVLILASMACNFGASGDDSEVVADFTPIVATPVVEQTTDPGDVAQGDPAATEESAPEPTENTGSAGVPETVSLENLVFGDENLANHVEKTHIRWEGTLTDGSPGFFDTLGEFQIQTDPEEAQRLIYTNSSHESEVSTLDSATLGGQQYIYYPEQGCTITAAENSQESLGDSWELLDIPLIGDAVLVEAGVEMDGLLTDHYAFDQSNLIVEGEPGGISSEVVTIEEGHVYVVRDGGWASRLEMKGEDLEGGDNFGFDPEQPVLFTLEQAYYPLAGAVTAPDGCEGENSSTEYPVMEGAQNFFSNPGGIFYEVEADVDDVNQFYKNEMAALGWTLDEETVITYFVELTFSRDGTTVIVQLAQNGTSVAVTVDEQ